MTPRHPKFITIAVILFGYLINPAQAQSALPLSSFEAPCNAFGAKAICKSVWSQGKHKSHRVQEYSIRTEAGAPMFAGRGLYRFGEGGMVTGFWEDTQGSIHPLDGTWDGETLKINWGTPETEQGRSAYVFTNDGMTATDWVLRADGEWHQFMTVGY